MISVVPKVALLEARYSSELSRLIEKHGGDAVCAPALEEERQLDEAAAERLISALAVGQYEVVVFLTGVAVSMVFEMGELLGRRSDLVAGLRRATTVCRGPKPAAALRGFGVLPKLCARDAYTSAEVIDALSSLDLKGTRVLLFHYGERSDSLAETLLARQAILDEQWLYRWRLPSDTSLLEDLVTRIVEGRIDALAVTCQIQFRHLFEIAAAMRLERDLVRSLNERVVVAAVGPTCRAILDLYGVDVHVVPDQPKMGPLVVALMRHLERRPTPLEGVRPASS